MWPTTFAPSFDTPTPELAPLPLKRQRTSSASTPRPALDASHEVDLRCGYAGKRCTNLRTDKKGGGLHRFCEFHRLRANKNQWRVDNKRRELRAFRRQQLKKFGGAAPAKTVDEVSLLPDPVDLFEDIEPMPIEDLNLLTAMLLGEAHSVDAAPEQTEHKLSTLVIPYEFVV